MAKNSKNFDIYRKIRKPIPPSTKVINPKKYERNNNWKEWIEDIDKDTKGDDHDNGDNT